VNLILAGLGAAGCLVGAGAAIYGLAAKAQQPRRIPNADKPSVPYLSAEWQSGGRTVRGWLLVQPGEGPKPAILVAHGWGSNRSRMLRYAYPLHREGYVILMYDARGHGDSDPHPAPSGLSFKEDLLAALDWLRRRADVDPERIGVIGHSLGGFGAVLALDDGAEVAAVVTDSMPVRFSTMIESELRRRHLPAYPLAKWLPNLVRRRSGIPRSLMQRADPAAILSDPMRRRGVPVLLIHSSKDTYVPSAEMEYVLSRAPDLPFLYVHTEGHSGSEKDPAFWPAVTAFFAFHLRPDKESGPAAFSASPSK
jgi:pimeloyl-ACP methyl ester carboxylesterase